MANERDGHRACTACCGEHLAETAEFLVGYFANHGRGALWPPGAPQARLSFPVIPASYADFAWPLPHRPRTLPKVVRKPSAGRFHFGLVAAQVLGFIALPTGAATAPFFA